MPTATNPRTTDDQTRPGSARARTRRRAARPTLLAAVTVAAAGLLAACIPPTPEVPPSGPTAPTTAFAFGDKIDDPLAMYLNDVATIPANLAGLPGMSLPSGLADEDGLPTGIQVLAPAMADDRLYSVGAALERALEARWGGPLLHRAPELTTSRKEA